VYVKQEDYRKAAEDFSRAIELNIRAQDVYFLRAESYWNMKDYEKAYQYYSAVIQYEPHYAVLAYSRRAECAIFTGRLNEAIENANKILELDPQATLLHGRFHICTV
jgi:tetratricopeptide (TPR) repeat protein